VGAKVGAALRRSPSEETVFEAGDLVTAIDVVKFSKVADAFSRVGHAENALEATIEVMRGVRMRRAWPVPAACRASASPKIPSCYSAAMAASCSPVGYDLTR
jgi:hypothetical protein